jgi:hypothetical protein
MEKQNFANLLLGKDLRTIGQNSIVVRSVTDQESFDELFGLMLHHERPLVMRAADAVEKITLNHNEYLQPHKNQLLSILKSADQKELKWHIAQLVSRLALDKKELEDVLHILTYWALNQNESKIVRVNALQGLFNLARTHPDLQDNFYRTMEAMEHEMIPSIQARIRKLRRSKM